MDKKLSSFHTKLKIWIPPLLIISLCFGLVFFFAIISKTDDIKDALNVSLMLSAGLAGFLCVLFTIVNFTYLVTVFTNGISSYDPFGSWKCDFMKWDDMNEVSRKNILGVKYLFVTSKEPVSSLWIPIELVNKDLFIRDVGLNAGNNHPLFVEILKGCT